ncbi:hypothetical protein [Angustibacter luteus]|uniref:Uncharacterized protein n=1 Tax=Angustibacter luteus TaxID=658456 RepID=A0ABW1JAK7_9ACTN
MTRAPQTTHRTAQAYRRAVLAAVDAAVSERLREVEVRGGSPDDLGEPAELAERMAATLPSAAHPLDVELGPFYDTTGLCAWWAVSRQALSDRVRRGTLLACRTADGHLVYPSFQFAKDGTVRAGIVDAVSVFSRHGVDGWTAAVWFTTPSPAFDGESAVDHLVVHRSSAAAVARVVGQAQADVATWAA